MTDRAILQPGETVLFLDAKDREYARTLTPGRQLGLRGGSLNVDDIIGLPEGSVVEVGRRDTYTILRPTYAHLIPNLPRRAQVIYPKDTAILLLWGDAFPGARVLEIGAGPGALTIALLNAIGPAGDLLTIEVRLDFCEMARENVRRYQGPTPNWTLRHADAYELRDVPERDRAFIDVAEPWRVVPLVAGALRPGGVLAAYVPTTIQIKSLVDELRDCGHFAAIEVMENLLRFWNVKGLSVRPVHRMVAHTGFIIIARRLAKRSPPPNQDVPETTS